MSSQISDFIRDHLLTLPDLAKFALGLILIVTVPRLCRLARIPSSVGLLLGGVIIGPYVLGIFGTERPIADFRSSPDISVRPNGAVHQWRKDPPRKLSVGPGS